MLKHNLEFGNSMIDGFVKIISRGPQLTRFGRLISLELLQVLSPRETRVWQ